MTTTTDYEYERYVATRENVMDVLTKYGVAIVPHILTQKECSDMVNGMWETLEHWSSDWETPISREEPASWRAMRNLFPSHSMLIQHWGVGHADFIWKLRQNKKCAEVFASIWGCSVEDLLVSFDGAAFHMPSEDTKLGWFRKSWMHTDQSPLRNDFECIQSWVTGLDVNEGDATLSVLEKSHKLHGKVALQFGLTEKNNWYKYTSEETAFLADQGCVEKRIRCPAGSLVLWDSRTAHCGVEPVKSRLSKNFRCIAYLCYMPRVMIPKKELDKVLGKRKKAYEDGRMTTHWPTKVRLFPKNPQTYGQPLPTVKELPLAEVGEFGRQLIGF